MSTLHVSEKTNQGMPPQFLIPAGKYAVTHVGRVAVRSPEEIHISTSTGDVQGVDHRHCSVVLRSESWGWSHQPEGVINAS